MRHSATNRAVVSDTAVTTSQDGPTSTAGRHSADRLTAVVVELPGGPAAGAQGGHAAFDHAAFDQAAVGRAAVDQAAVGHASFDRAADPGADDHLLVHVQLRPRRASARKCLAALAQLATQHAGVPVCLAGLSKDDRVLRITVAIDLGPRLEVARFSPAAQAAYGFVSDLFTVLYDHMPVYATEPTPEESAVVAPFLRAGDQAAWGSTPVWQTEVLGAVTA